jgi:hypothetical protein
MSAGFRVAGSGILSVRTTKREYERENGLVSRASISLQFAAAPARVRRRHFSAENSLLPRFRPDVNPKVAGSIPARPIYEVPVRKWFLVPAPRVD